MCGLAQMDLRTTTAVHNLVHLVPEPNMEWCMHCCNEVYVSGFDKKGPLVAMYKVSIWMKTCNQVMFSVNSDFYIFAPVILSQYPVQV